MGVTCLYCGSRLSLLQKVSGQPFCSRSHRADYAQLQETLALERLRETPKAVRELPVAPWARQEAGRQKGPLTRAAGEPPCWEPFLALPQLIQQVQAHSERTRLTVKPPRAANVECGPMTRQAPAEPIRIEAEAELRGPAAMPAAGKLDSEWENPVERMPRHDAPFELGMLWVRAAYEPVDAPVACGFRSGARQ
jgi:hypothetical protein